MKTLKCLLVALCLCLMVQLAVGQVCDGRIAMFDGEKECHTTYWPHWSCGPGTIWVQDACSDVVNNGVTYCQVLGWMNTICEGIYPSTCISDAYILTITSDQCYHGLTADLMVASTDTRAIGEIFGKIDSCYRVKAVVADLAKKFPSRDAGLPDLTKVVLSAKPLQGYPVKSAIKNGKTLYKVGKVGFWVSIDGNGKIAKIQSDALNTDAPEFAGKARASLKTWKFAAIGKPYTTFAQVNVYPNIPKK